MSDTNITITQTAPATITIVGGTPGAPGAISVDAPNDSTPYVREDSAWVSLESKGVTVPTADKLVKTDADGLITPQFIDPNKYPSLVLDFATGNGKDEKPCATRYQSNGIQKLDGFDNIVTFTRASAGSYYDANGRLVFAGVDEPRFDHDPATLEQKGLLVEESRTQGIIAGTIPTNSVWVLDNTATSVPNAGVAPDGSNQAIRIIESSAGAAIIRNRDLTITAGTKIASSVYLKAGSVTQVRLQVNSNATTGFRTSAVVDLTTGALSSLEQVTFVRLGASATDVGNGWWRVSVETDTTGNSVTGVQLRLIAQGSVSAGRDFYFWGMQNETGSFPTSYIPSTDTFTSRASTGTYYDASGIIQSAAIDVERLTYNPSDLTAPASQLFEEARTNILLRSEQFDNATWLKSAGVSITPDAVVAPDGTLSGDTMTKPAVGFTYVRQTVTAPVGVHTFSVYVKSGTLGKVSVLLTGDGGATLHARVVFDMVAETWTSFSSTNFIGASIRAVENGWFEVSVSADLTTNSSPQVYVYPDTYSATIAGDIYIWGAQLEEGSYPTSYIPTTTTAVTRSADVYTSVASTRAAEAARITNLSPWFNQSAGSFSADAEIGGGNFPYVLGMTDGGDAERHIIYRKSGAATTATPYEVLTTDGGVSQAGLSLLGSSTRLGWSYATDSFIATGDTATTISDTQGTLPTVTELTIGSKRGALHFANGHIKQIKYYPYAMTQAELEAVTL